MEGERASKRPRSQAVVKTSLAFGGKVIEDIALTDEEKEFLSNPLQASPEVALRCASSPTCFDVLIEVAGYRFPAIIALVSHRSKFFEAMLSGRFAEGGQPLIKLELPCVEVSAFELVLKYLHTGIIDNDATIPSKYLVSVARIAAYVDAEALSQACVTKLSWSWSFALTEDSSQFDKYMTTDLLDRVLTAMLSTEVDDDDILAFIALMHDLWAADSDKKQELRASAEKFLARPDFLARLTYAKLRSWLDEGGTKAVVAGWIPATYGYSVFIGELDRVLDQCEKFATCDRCKRSVSLWMFSEGKDEACEYYHHPDSLEPDDEDGDVYGCCGRRQGSRGCEVKFFDRHDLETWEFK